MRILPKWLTGSRETESEKTRAALKDLRDTIQSETLKIENSIRQTKKNEANS